MSKSVTEPTVEVSKNVQEPVKKQENSKNSNGSNNTTTPTDPRWNESYNPNTPIPTKDSDMGALCPLNGKNQMDYATALQIARRDCVQATIKNDHACNNYTNTWWIDIDVPGWDYEVCPPACVVDVIKKTATIQNRCKGQMNF